MTSQPERDLMVALFRRIGEQPEFKEAFEKLPNAERNYMAGDFYNIIASHSSAPAEQAIRDQVLDELVKIVSKRCGCNQDIEHADIPIIHVDELAEIIAELRTPTPEAHPELNDDHKPGCFGAYGSHSCDIPGCIWFSRCKQSQEDY